MVCPGSPLRWTRMRSCSKDDSTESSLNAKLVLEISARRAPNIFSILVAKVRRVQEMGGGYVCRHGFIELTREMLKGSLTQSNRAT